MDAGLLWTKWRELNSVFDGGMLGWAEWTWTELAHKLENKVQTIFTTENIWEKVQQKHKYETDDV